jgi:hypothetical protein
MKWKSPAPGTAGTGQTAIIWPWQTKMGRKIAGEHVGNNPGSPPAETNPLSVKSVTASPSANRGGNGSVLHDALARTGNGNIVIGELQRAGCMRPTVTVER